MTNTRKVQLLLFFSSIAIVTMCFVPPIPQSSTYHLFADARTIASIPNAYNVLSNLPFLLFGALGMNSVLQKEKNALSQNRLFFFIGVLLTGVGSGYYHWQPCIETLVWDRLPMVIAFMSFFTLIIGEYIDEKWGQKLLFPMLTLGITSVFYWYWSEMKQQGDLRPYALVQFLPLILTPMIMLLFERKLGKTTLYWSIIAVYVLAKVFETFDSTIFMYFPISGHSLKHLARSRAAFLFWKK